MRCPFCGCSDSKVLDTRSLEDGSIIRRRRECVDCAKRFTTYERIETVPLTVVKKGGQRVPFDKNKLLEGMIRACYKRPVSIANIQKAADNLEKQLYRCDQNEISSAFIGEKVMAILKDMDQIAYVRFASVYREFKDIETFMSEIKTLISEKS